MLPKNLLARIEKFSLRRHGAVFAVFAVLIAISVYLGTRLQLDTDILSMVPSSNKKIEIFKRSLRDFGSLDYLLILVSAPDDGAVANGGTSAEDYEEFADELAARLEKSKNIEYVEYRLDETSPILSNLSENALVFLGPEKLSRIRPIFEDESIRRRVSELREKLQSQPSFIAKLQATMDPLGMLPVLYDAFLKNRGAFRIDLMDGYYLSSDRKSLLIIAKPNRPPQDVAFSDRLLVEVEDAKRATIEKLRSGLDEDESDPFARMTVDYGGGYVIAHEDAKLIKGDILWNALISFFLVTGLYLFCYRRFAAIAYSTIPLAAGQALTFAVAFLFLNGLNSATSGFTALLMGLGTDFTIVMYARYIEERRLGRSLEEAVSRIMGETAIGVFTGVITSAGTFYAMCVTEFPGLRDFGFLVGTGILLCGVTILFLLPAMIAYVEGERVTRLASLFAFLVFPVLPLPLLRWMERRRLHKAGKAQKLYLHSFGVERLLIVAARWPVPTAFLSFTICALLGVLALNIDFSENLKDLRSGNNKGVLVQEEIGRRFGGSLNYMIVMCHGTTFDEALERNRRVTAKLDGLASKGDIQGYESLLTYLPAREAQEAVIRGLAPGSPGAFDVDRIEKTFRAALQDNGFRPGSYDEYLARLRRMLRPEKALTIEDLEQRGLGELVGRYHRVVNGEHVTATYLFPNPERLDRDRLESVASELEGGDPKIEATSVILVGLELRRLFRRDATLAVSVGLLLVAALLYVDFRKVSLTIIAMLQLILGVVFMLGGMKVLGIQMNFINAFATTMILGVGVDYGIHMIHRLSRASSPADEGILETGKAVVMAALTNIAGFGTVAFSNYPGLKGVGLVCILGTIGCLFTSLTLLPALMALYRRPGPPEGAPVPAHKV